MGDPVWFFLEFCIFQGIVGIINRLGWIFVFSTDLVEYTPSPYAICSIYPSFWIPVFCPAFKRGNAILWACFLSNRPPCLLQDIQGDNRDQWLPGGQGCTYGVKSRINVLWHMTVKRRQRSQFKGSLFGYNKGNQIILSRSHLCRSSTVYLKYSSQYWA